MILHHGALYAFKCVGAGMQPALLAPSLPLPCPLHALVVALCLPFAYPLIALWDVLFLPFICPLLAIGLCCYVWHRECSDYDMIWISYSRSCRVHACGVI